MRFKLDNITPFYIVAIIFFIGNMISLDLFDLNQKVQNEWVIILITCFLLYVFIFQIKFLLTRKKIVLLIIWELFIISVFISKYIHGSFLLLEFLLYSLMIPLTFFGSGILKYKITFMVASTVSITPFLLLLKPWNGLAVLICISGIILLGLLIIKNIKTEYIYIYIIIFMAILFVTKSRTTLITFFIVSCIFTLFSIFKKSATSYINFNRKGLLILSFVTIGYFSFNHLRNLFLNKWGPRTNEIPSLSDLTSGRSDIWIGTLKNGVKLFGNGEGYFLDKFQIAHAHNIFFQILGAYGFVSLLLFLLLLLYIVFYTLKLRHKIEYLYFFTGFFVMGLAENLLPINSHLIYPSLIFFVYLGSLSNEKNYSLNK